MKIYGSTGKVSRTIKFNIVMDGLIALHGGLHLLQPVMSAEAFGYLSVILAVVVAMGNKYLRAITTEPLKEKP